MELVFFLVIRTNTGVIYVSGFRIPSGALNIAFTKYPSELKAP
jgi:hypothetical protein